MENKDRDREQGTGFGSTDPSKTNAEQKQPYFGTEPLGEEQKPESGFYHQEGGGACDIVGEGESSKTFGQTSTGSEKKEQIKDYVREQAGMAKEQAKSMLSRTGTQVAGTLDDVCVALHDMASRLDEENHKLVGGYVHSAAEQLDRASSALRNNDVDVIIDRAEQQIRRSPALFLGGAIALGFLMGRFVKSSGERTHGYEGEFESEGFSSPETMESFYGESATRTGSTSPVTSGYGEE